MAEKSSVKAKIEQTNYITSITYKEFQWRVDEPIDVGGSNTAAAPEAYLKSALASCIAITLKMYVDRKKWNLGQITVIIEENEENVYHKKISVSNEITDEQKQKLNEIAEKCPISKLLKSGVSMTSEIV